MGKTLQSQYKYIKRKINKYKKLQKKISDDDKGKSIVTLTHNDIVELRKLIDDQVEVLESIKSFIDETLENRSKKDGEIN